MKGFFLARKEKKLLTCEYHQQKTLSCRHMHSSGFLSRISREIASWILRELGSVPDGDAGNLAVSLLSVESVEGAEVLNVSDSQFLLQNCSVLNIFNDLYCSSFSILSSVCGHEFIFPSLTS